MEQRGSQEEEEADYGLNWGPTAFPEEPEEPPEALGAPAGGGLFGAAEEEDEEWVMVEAAPGLHSRYGDEYYSKYDGVSSVPARGPRSTDPARGCAVGVCLCRRCLTCIGTGSAECGSLPAAEPQGPGAAWIV